MMKLLRLPVKQASCVYDDYAYYVRSCLIDDQSNGLANDLHGNNDYESHQIHVHYCNAAVANYRSGYSQIELIEHVTPTAVQS